MCPEPPRRGEEGFALIASLLLVVIVSAVVAVLVSNVFGELRGTGDHRDREAAVHAAEAALEVVAERVAVGPAYATGHAWPFAGTPTTAQERTWARAQYAAALAAATPPGSLLALPGATCGQTGTCQPIRALGIRPTTGGVPMPVVYGVAAAAGQGPAQARVVRVAIPPFGYRPTHALLTAGDLVIDATLAVTGAAGNVHTNLSLDVRRAMTATGDVTAVGTFLGTANVTVPPGRTKAGSQPAVALPSFTSATYYGRRFEVPAADWYDLCPDGQVHARSAGAPCTGVIIAPPSGVRSAGGRWEMHQTTVTDGVYYVHQRDLTITAATGSGLPVRPRVTVIAARTSCTSGGSIDTDGNAVLDPYMADGTLFVAERELRLRRRAVLGSSARPAFVATTGHLRFDNDPVLNGAAVALHTCPGERTELRGQPTIAYDGNLQVGIDGTGVRIGAWEEL